MSWNRNKFWLWVVGAALFGLALSPSPARAQACAGDCNGNGTVSAGELTIIIARIVNCTGVPTGPCGTSAVPDCANADANTNGSISAGELTRAIFNIINGCGPVPTATPRPATVTPTPTVGVAGVCGNGVVESGEDCDNGGTCVNGPNFCFGGAKNGQACDLAVAFDCGLDGECHGNACTSNAQCGGGTCKPFGGDGCAVNCTTETARVFRFSGGECDNFGPNLGNVCLSNSECGGTAGRCKAVGECNGGSRDGLKCRVGSVNTDHQCPGGGTCVSGSQATVQINFTAIPISPISGGQTLMTGRAGPDGRIPVAIPANSVSYSQIQLTGIACVCTRGRAVPDLHGPGNSGSGWIGCGPEGLTNVNVDYSRDHNTTPGHQNNGGGRCQVIGGLTAGVSKVCQTDADCPGSICISPDDAACTNQDLPQPTGSGVLACQEKREMCFQGANAGMPCAGGADCPDGTCGTTCNNASLHVGVCNGPTHFRAGGTGPRGSAVIQATSGFGLIPDGGTCCKAGDPGCAVDPLGLKGPDRIPCTDDDPIRARGNAVTSPATTAIASASIIDANSAAGVVMTQGSLACGAPCTGAVSGRAFNCDALAANPTGGLTGVRLANAFPALDQSNGDYLVTNVLTAK